MEHGRREATCPDDVVLDDMVFTDMVFTDMVVTDMLCKDMLPDEWCSPARDPPTCSSTDRPE
jgi:hypothetical protein